MPEPTNGAGEAIPRAIHDVHILSRSAVRALCAELATLARDEARGPQSMLAPVAKLCAAGLLRAPLRKRFGGAELALRDATVSEAVDLLVAIGSADLCMARLFEGHLNALRLIDAHGSGLHARRAAGVIEAGGMLGVWGADLGQPVTLTDGRLSGVKQFCSGLGVVRLAIVPVRSGTLQRLVLVSTEDPARADVSAWRMQGMRATHSGHYDFEGMVVGEAELLGEAGVYAREPYFLGGVWRLAAAELGGVFGLLEEARSILAARDRLTDPIQTARLGDVLIAAHAARTLTIAAGEYAEGPRGRAAPERAANHAIFARLAAERTAEETLTVVTKALGLGAHVAATVVERRLRDLSTYIRQMTPDALRARATRALLDDPGPLAGAFDA